MYTVINIYIYTHTYVNINMYVYIYIYIYIYIIYFLLCMRSEVVRGLISLHGVLQVPKGHCQRASPKRRVGAQRRCMSF